MRARQPARARRSGIHGRDSACGGAATKALLEGEERQLCVPLQLCQGPHHRLYLQHRVILYIYCLYLNPNLLCDDDGVHIRCNGRSSHSL